MKRFRTLLEAAMQVATRQGLDWHTPIDQSGAILKGHRWNVAELAGRRGRSGNFYFSDTAPDESAVNALNEVRLSLALPRLIRRPPTDAWIDLMKITIIDNVFTRNNRPQTIQRRVLCLRILAAEAEDTPPWAIEPVMIRRAYNAALAIGSSGKTATDLASTVRTVIDDCGFAAVSPLARYCSASDQDAAKVELEGRLARNRHRSHAAIFERLEDRPSPEKLPDEKSYNKLKQIIFGAVPKTFSDRIRFPVLKIHLVTGLRIEEVLSAPLWALMWREYFDFDGTPAGEKGGVARDLWFRHFASKKPTEENKGELLFETSQVIPLRFQEMVADTIQEVVNLTAPARKRLKLQYDTGRLFPEFLQDELVPASEMYVRLSGNALFSRAAVPDDLINAYRKSGDIEILRAIRSSQSDASIAPSQISYWSKHNALIARDVGGSEVRGKRNWEKCYFRIGEIEEYFGEKLRFKGPEIGTYRLHGGAGYGTHDMMFLIPTRNVIEGRNGGLLDAELYYAFKRIDYRDIDIALDGRQPDSIFRRYLGAEGRNLRIKTHQNRHLQTTELYRHGVSDAIVTKRFNRTSLTQSRVYDNRSLSERFEALDLGDVALDVHREPQKRALEAIQSGKLAGPKVQTFLKCQSAPKTDPISASNFDPL
ncbi:hypothetical protein MRS76_14490, partial [Rhizobiaceae bacterium n13]|uniref:hypothetical protein n=1 Tax=Ferirhizobium litorale TaxID=2927786 RepID=UPI0024B31498